MIGSKVSAKVRASVDVERVGNQITGTYLGIAYYGAEGNDGSVATDTYLMIVDDNTGFVVDVPSSDVQFNVKPKKLGGWFDIEDRDPEENEIVVIQRKKDYSTENVTCMYRNGRFYESKYSSVGISTGVIRWRHAIQKEIKTFNKQDEIEIAPLAVDNNMN